MDEHQELQGEHKPGEQFDPEDNLPEPEKLEKNIADIEASVGKVDLSNRDHGPKKAVVQPWLKAALVGFIILAFVVIGWFYFTDRAEAPTNSNGANTSDTEPAAISSYEECVAAGYPIMESYPEQCAVPDGPTFTRQLTLEEQANLQPSYETPPNYSPYFVEPLRMYLDIPDSWTLRSSSSDSESIFEQWITDNGVDVRLSAASTDTCPQGDAAPLSLYQGYYSSGGLNYANWCPEENLDEEYLVNEEASVNTVGLGEALWKRSSTSCENNALFCSQEDVNAGHEIINFS